MRIRNHPLELRISEIFKQECIAIILTTIIVLSSPEYASALDHDSNSNTTVANQKNESSIFIQHILDIYGSNSTITIDNLQNLISTIQNFNKKDEHIDDIDTKLHEQHRIDLDHNKNIDPMCENSTSVLNNHNHCLTTKCLSAEEILQIHSISSNHELSHSDFGNLSATVLYQLQNPACYSAEINTHRKVSPSAAEVWGYGFICVTLINLCSLMGLFFLPLMQKSYYNRILMFMVALAVGTLVGSSLLFLIPNALSLVDEASPLGGLYLWRCTVIMAGIYMFFLTERIIKLITEYKVSRAAMKEIDKNVGRSLCSVKIHEQHTDSQMGHVSFTPAHMNTEENQLNGKCTGDRAADNHTLLQQHNNDLSPDKLSVEIANGIQKSNGHSHGATHVVNGRSKIKPVAWMVIFGDGLHNFIDGLSIGAAFADNTWAGISISLAVICEELPHELGDFAILLNSGMSMRKALGYNFLSACMCYLGTAVGIMVGELTAGSEWIFAIAGGMFLYIALVDMFPEVNAAAEEEVASMPYSLSHSLKIFALQNAGLIVGFGIMIILAKFGEDISFVE